MTGEMKFWIFIICPFLTATYLCLHDYWSIGGLMHGVIIRVTWDRKIWGLV